jgi:hypothetical protein
MNVLLALLDRLRDLAIHPVYLESPEGIRVDFRHALHQSDKFMVGAMRDDGVVLEIDLEWNGETASVGAIMSDLLQAYACICEATQLIHFEPKGESLVVSIISGNINTSQHVHFVLINILGPRAKAAVESYLSEVR